MSSADRGLLPAAIHASRPVSWINTAFPFAAAMVLTTRQIDWVLIVGTVFFLVPYNLAMYGINDVFDYESDLANPRKDSIEGALLPPRQHRPLLWLVLATTVPFLVALCWAGGVTGTAWLAISMFAVVAYSFRGLRFKERPFLDSATSATHFVSPAVVGFVLAGASWGWGTIATLTAFFLWGMAAHAFGAVQDITPDRSAGIGSIATALGARATVRVSITFWTLAALVMLTTPWPGPLAALIPVPYLINCWPYRHVEDAEAHRTNPAWRRFIYLNYLCGFMVTMLLIYTWTLRG